MLRSLSPADLASIVRYHPAKGLRLLGNWEIAGLVSLILLPVLGAATLFSQLTAHLALLNAAMILAGVPVAIATWRLILSGGADIEVTPTHLRTLRKGRVIQEIDLREVARIDCNEMNSRAWMVVRYRDGEKVSIGNVLSTWPLNPQLAARELQRMLPQNIAFSDGTNGHPSINVLFASGKQMPGAIEMKPGLRYRYSYPRNLARLIVDESPRFDRWFFRGAVGLVTILIAFGVPVRGFANLLLTISACISMWAFRGSFRTAHAFLVGPARKLSRSIGDRFVLTPEGQFKVLRGDDAWLFDEAQSTAGRYELGGSPVVQLGRGRNTYYFDPRFIERDL